MNRLLKASGTLQEIIEGLDRLAGATEGDLEIECNERKALEATLLRGSLKEYVRRKVLCNKFTQGSSY